MSPDAAPTFPTAQALAEHVDFLRSLARRLVRDEHAAEDLVQDALVAGLQHDGAQVRGLRAWFAGVMRHRQADAWEAKHRRAHHERAAARPEAGAPDPGAVGEQLDVQRALADAVAELQEPYRSVIFLRFYEELPPRRIAERLGLPVTTVKTRLHRGLEQLRAKLDATHGGRRERWCAALVGLLDPPRSLSPAPAIGSAGWILGAGALMKTKVALVAAVALLALGGWILSIPAQQARGAPALAPEAGAATELPAVARSSSAAQPEAAARRAGATEADAASLAPLRGWHLAGRVIDASGAGVPGAEVRIDYGHSNTHGVEQASRECRTDERGAFAADLLVPPEVSSHAPLFVQAEARGPRGRTGSLGLFHADPRRDAHGETLRVEIELMEDPPAEITGRVVDRHGAPLGGVPVKARTEDGEIPYGLTTRADGRFEYPLSVARSVLGSPGALEPLTLSIGSDVRGFVEAGPVDPDAEPRADLGELVLDTPGRMDGRVLFPDGRPAAGIELRLVPEARAAEPRGEGPSTVTDVDGRFGLSALVPGPFVIHVLGLGSHGPKGAFGPFHTGEFAELVLDAQRLTVRVVDGEGRALPESTVRIEGGMTVAQGARAEVRFGVVPGSYRVVASLDHSELDRNAPSAPDAAWGSAAIEIEAGDYDVVREVTVDVEAARGELRVVATDDAGATLDGSFAIVLRLPEMRDDLFELLTCAAGAARGVPAGRYEARVLRAEDRGRRLQHFEAESQVEVRGGETNEVKVVLQRGGWIELTTGPAGAADEPPVSMSVRLDALDEGWHSGGGFRPREDPPRGPRPRQLELGQPLRSELLRPGRYRVRVQAEGRRAEPREVQVQAGETAALEFELLLD